MAYRVSAATASGAAISIIVETGGAALKKIVELREDGFTSIVVRDMHGLDVDPEDLEQDLS